jgi:hypothetical protein
MKKIYALKQGFVLSTAFLLFTHYIQAQNIFPSTGSAGIGTTTPNASSILEMVSTSKGLLIPRMTKIQRDANIPVTPLTPAGLLIFQTDNTPGFYYYAGTSGGWKAITPKVGWLLTGNANTDPATNFIGTTDAQPLQFKVNNVKAGYLDNIHCNTGFGYQTLNANTSMFANTAIGYQALYSDTGGSSNTANGFRALYANTTGSQNTANGFEALDSNTTGYWNTANGYESLSLNTIGVENTANGAYALFSNIIGVENTANGAYALFSNITGHYNTANGYRALYSNTKGNYNTALGYSADVSAVGLTNAMALGWAALVNAKNKVVIGNTQVNVIGGQVGWSTFSDGRFKSNIKENVPGLTFINKLRPVTYKLELKKFDKFLGKKDGLINSMQADYAVSEKKVHTGFVAQDVEKASDEIHYDFDGVNHPQNEKDNYSLVYADFVPSLVKAVQELSTQNDELKKQNDDLAQRLAKLEAMMNVQQSTTNSKLQIANLSSASLAQNIPNPFSNTTTINYSLPQKYSSAKIIVIDESGNTIKIFNLSGAGKSSINFSSPFRVGASYQYSLLVDGKLVDTKQMILAK